jgi:hypothetical protein
MTILDAADLKQQGQLDAASSDQMTLLEVTTVPATASDIAANADRELAQSDDYFIREHGDRAVPHGGGIVLAVLIGVAGWVILLAPWIF